MVLQQLNNQTTGQLPDVQTIGDIQDPPRRVCQQTQTGDPKELAVPRAVPGNVRHHWGRPIGLYDSEISFFPQT